MFSASANLLKKIRKLEKDHADFLRWDQLLYQDWYNLTFRTELQAGEQLERRYRTLSTFHLHLNHIARTSQVSLENAYVMLKEEEAQYQAGDEAWKFVIEKLRQQRFENAMKPKTSAPGSSSEPQLSKEKMCNLADMLAQDESALSGLRRYARSIYHYLNDIDDGMMGRHLSDMTAGYQLFKESFQIAMKCGDWKLLARIWKTGGSAYQQKLLKPMPSHLKDFLLQMFAEYGEQETVSPEQTEAEISLRSSYRKLARLLHPDTWTEEPSEDFQEWSSKKWQKVQTAYQAHDHEALKRLEIICRAEQGQLNHMTMDEIYESSLVLAEELEALKANLRACRKHPAWRFSSRRRYDALTIRVRREMKQRYTPMEAQVRALENMLENLARRVVVE